jgi:DNA-binding MarR family transcriptional regulator
VLNEGIDVQWSAHAEPPKSAFVSNRRAIAPRYRASVLCLSRLDQRPGRGAGRAKRRPGITIAGLLDILAVTKQSLNRVLRQLVEDGLVVSTTGTADRRQRHLRLSPEGEMLERELSEPQRARLRRAYSEAGPEAVAGFREVLERMINEGGREAVLSLVGQDGS